MHAVHYIPCMGVARDTSMYICTIILGGPGACPLGIFDILYSRSYS